VNLFGTHRVTRAALPLLRARRSGCIVNFGSAAGSAGPAGLGAYEASKAAVDRLSAALRAEVSSFGIRVIVVAPGGVRTEWAGSSLRHVARWLPAYDPTVGQTRKRLGDVDGHQDGDPDVVATVIREAVTSPNPPSRLLIGVDAHRSSSAQLHQEAADLMRWRPSTAGPSTDP
jgi:NAD(P)-dependent dehydrogenase (short-subunit alcohol dehydrogenase family)